MPEAIYQPVAISDGVYWVGAVDWEVRLFHGHHFVTPRGTTYNAYFIRAKKCALIDTVHAPFATELLARLEALDGPEKIDYMIVNHVEADHAGALGDVMAKAPQATIICSRAGAKVIQARYPDAGWKIQTVKTGDTVDLGGRTLSFVEAPMLHWPDSMFTYCPELALLLPNDAFGQHLASSGRFDDEVDQAALFDEASKYYAGILTPFNTLVEKKIKDLLASGLAVKMIAPSHGIIWRKAPQQIIEAYLKWATSPGEPCVVVAYETMWGSTEAMARAVVEGVVEAGVEAKLFSVPTADRTALVRDICMSRGLALGCSTINKRVLPAMAALLDDIQGLNPPGKIGFAFGSQGWAGGAIKLMEETLEAIKANKIIDGIKATDKPTPAELAACRAAGKQLAEAVKAAD
jgi:anaerobic nitric oxide reductase flavorubredoxin